MKNSEENVFARCGNCCEKKFWSAKKVNDLPQGFPCIECGAWNDVELLPDYIFKSFNVIELTVLKTIEGYLFDDP